MGSSKKDLGDVVWSSETSRDPVFLTSRPKDIAYPQFLRRPRTKFHKRRHQRAYDRSFLVRGGFKPPMPRVHQPKPAIIGHTGRRRPDHVRLISKTHVRRVPLVYRTGVPDTIDLGFSPNHLRPDELGHHLCWHVFDVNPVVPFNRHTLQLLPGRRRRSYAGAVVLVLQGLDGRLSLQHEGRIIAAQEAPPGPGSLRNGIKPSSGDAIQSPDPKGLSEPRETVPEPLTMVAAANGHGSVIDDEAVVSMTVTASPRRSTFLQQARWDAVQRAKLEGMPVRKMARELGLHRDTVRRYIDVESPPTRRPPATLPASTSDTIPE